MGDVDLPHRGNGMTRRNRITFTCLQCGVEFEGIPSDRSRYCTVRCMGAAFVRDFCKNGHDKREVGHHGRGCAACNRTQDAARKRERRRSDPRFREKENRRQLLRDRPRDRFALERAFASLDPRLKELFE